MSRGNIVGAQKPISLKLAQVMVCGRVEQIRSFDGMRYTRIAMPASSAHSRPRVVEVYTKQKLGEKGDEVTVVCSLGGCQRKPYQLESKDISEMEAIMSVDHMFDVVEA